MNRAEGMGKDSEFQPYRPYSGKIPTEDKDNESLHYQGTCDCPFRAGVSKSSSPTGEMRGMELIHKPDEPPNGAHRSSPPMLDSVPVVLAPAGPGLDHIWHPLWLYWDTSRTWCSL